jgi:23S rRNA pseudouridine1911/1915/1917 synthase
MSEQRKQLQFKVTTGGTRLDKYVSEIIPDLSRARAQKFIENGNISVNGKVEKASYKVLAGDTLQIEISAPSRSSLVPEEIDVPILYKDQQIIVVDKPAGLTVHPSHTQPSHTLVNAVLPYLTDVSAEVERPGIVHRLDKDTSGVMVIARSPIAHENLASQFKRHTVKKVYLTLVKGHLIPEKGIIEAPIGRDAGDRKKMAVTAESRGREALTRYRVVRYIKDYTLLEVMPQTGRTHQIRVHLAAIGFPVVGDVTYGTKSKLVSRQFLHAHKLGFNHPSTEEYVEFTSPLPDDLTKALKELS